MKDERGSSESAPAAAAAAAAAVPVTERSSTNPARTQDSNTRSLVRNPVVVLQILVP